MGAIAFWVVLFLVIGVLQSLAQQRRRAGPPTANPKAPGGPPPRAQARRGSPPRRQRTFQDVLEELRRGLDQPHVPRAGERGPLGRPATVGLESAEEVEETASLEVERETESLETDVRRAERATGDEDREGEVLIQRRLKAAEGHGRRLTLADHRAFDEQIRQRQADASEAEAKQAEARAARLRRAVIWREVLGKPLGLRSER